VGGRYGAGEDVKRRLDLPNPSRPATGETVWEAPRPSRRGAGRADRRAAFPDWADRPRQVRIDAVKRYQAVLRPRAADGQAISEETGKALWRDRRAQGHGRQGGISIRAYDERTGSARRNRLPRDASPPAAQRRGGARPVQLPGHLPNAHIVPPLLAGDTVIFKPSEETPHR
jgi:succinylglutamic semialdehyde dehydrogenase